MTELWYPEAIRKPCLNCTDPGHTWPKIDAIIMHHTAGTIESAYQRFSLPRNPKTGASCQFGISREGVVYQYVPLDRIAWQAGVWKWNTCTVGIEHEHYEIPSGWTDWTPNMLKASAKLIAWIRIIAGDAPLWPHNKVKQTACPMDLPISTIDIMARNLAKGIKPVDDKFDELFYEWFTSCCLVANENAGIYQELKKRVRAGEPLTPPFSDECDLPTDSNLTVQYGANWKASYNKTTHEIRIERI